MELKLSFPGHQSTIGSTASIGKHRKLSFTQIDPSRGRSQPPVQQQRRQAWHDRQLRQKPIGKGCLTQYFDLAPGKLQTKWLEPYRTHNGAVQL